MYLYEYFSGDRHHLEKRFSLLSAEPKFYIQMPSGEAAPVFDYKTFPFEIFMGAPTIHKKGKSRDRVEYYNLVTAFDIETTTILSDEPFAFMYQWQYCIEDYIFMGKTWEEFQEFIQLLSTKLGLYIRQTDEDLIIGKSLVTYVHNLSYEFQFMRFFLGDLVHPLVTDKYAPLLIPTKLGITFRCSYRLTNKTLEKFTKGFEHAKLAGDLDYSIKRTPETPMTDTELAYCYCDVKGLCEALRDRLEKDKHYSIASIPLTSTGYVRKDCQKSMNSESKNRANFQKSKLTPELYRLLRAAFRGGNTHANAAYSGKLIGEPCKRYPYAKGGKIKHRDIGSSYPSSILINTFPMGPFIRSAELEGRYRAENFNPLMRKFVELCRANCILLKVRLIDVRYIGSCGVPYIPISKTMYRISDKDEIIEDNGRIYSAPLLEMALTDIDFKIIMRDYQIGALEITEAYTSWRGKLPEELRSVVLDYYKKKTLLKHADSPEDQYEYAKAKEHLNSTYGMMVMRIDRLEFEYVDNEYKCLDKPLQEQIDTYYESRSNCLPYQWGVWVTANSRARLQEGLDICGKDTLYTDTDSVFYIGDHEAEFEALNDKLRKQAELAGAVAENRAGESFPIGLWDIEHDSIKLFMTLGAKKYILSVDGEHLETTIAGVSKKLGAEYFTEHGFEAFRDDTIIRDSGKIAAVYNNQPPHYIEIDGVKILTAANIAMIPSAYTVHITDKYGRFIEMIRKSLYI